MWLHHLWNLLWSAAGVFIRSLGNTWLGFVVNALFAVGTTAITLYRVRQTRGAAAMKVHWQDETKVALKVGFLCAACLYVPIGIYAVGMAIYSDHEGLVAVSKGQRNAIKRMSDDPLAPNAHEIPVSPGSTNTKYFVYLANKLTVPAVVVVHCDGPISQVQGVMAETHFMMARPSSEVVPGHADTWAFEIDSPPWSPTEPMFISYKYNGVAPRCGFEARE